MHARMHARTHARTHNATVVSLLLSILPSPPNTHTHPQRSGDDITNICRDAAMNGMRRKIAGKSAAEIREMSKDDMKEPVTMEDFLQVCARACVCVCGAERR
jgi:SpoVK/Ycf46/Vps4 family AAA+-type ATPase